MAKNTRLIYTDEAHIKMYEAMPADKFKEFMLAVMKYQYGDDSILNNISDPMVKALFISEKQHIDYNEEKYIKKVKTAQENGEKSKGRPKKEKEAEVSVYTESEKDIEEEYNPVDYQSAKDIQHEQTDKKTLWIVAIANEDPKWGTSRHLIFDKGWKEFYHSRYDAVAEVSDILKNKSIHVSLG